MGWISSTVLLPKFMNNKNNPVRQLRECPRIADLKWTDPRIKHPRISKYYKKQYVYI